MLTTGASHKRTPVSVKYDPFDLSPALRDARFRVKETDGEVAILELAHVPWKEAFEQIVRWRPTLIAEGFSSVEVGGKSFELSKAESVKQLEALHEEEHRKLAQALAPRVDRSVIEGTDTDVRKELQALFADQIPDGVSLQIQEREEQSVTGLQETTRYFGRLRIKVKYGDVTIDVLDKKSVNESSSPSGSGYYTDRVTFYYRLNREEASQAISNALDTIKKLIPD